MCWHGVQTAKTTWRLSTTLTTLSLPQEVADSCRTGAATNIIFGLALGYQSAIIPCIVIAICIFLGFSFASLFGIACAALGMLTTLATGAVPMLVPGQCQADTAGPVACIWALWQLWSALPLRTGSRPHAGSCLCLFSRQSKAVHPTACLPAAQDRLPACHHAPAALPLGLTPGLHHRPGHRCLRPHL